MAILTTPFQLDWAFIGAMMRISPDAARMRYSRIRQRIYAATTPLTNPNPTNEAAEGEDNVGTDQSELRRKIYNWVSLKRGIGS